MKQKIRCASSDVLCLSLDWSNRRHISSSVTSIYYLRPLANSPRSTIGKLAVSLSDRTLSILQPDSTNALAVTDTWHAHEFEPWITAWDYWCTDLLFSGK